MKIAVLLTGQLRTFEMTKYLHMHSLIHKYDSDVFLGIDVNNELQVEYKNSTKYTDMQTVEKAIIFFKPIDSFILTDFCLEDVPFNDIRRLRQYYVVKNVYKMLKNHKEKNNIKYDLIIRLRFDQYIFSKEVPMLEELWCTTNEVILYNENNIHLSKTFYLNKKFTFEEINPNTIYVFGFGDFCNYKYVNDQFFYHDESLIEQMFEFYDNMLDIFKDCLEKEIGNKGCMTELIFYTYLTNNNIIIKKSNICGIFVREFLCKNVLILN